MYKMAKAMAEYKQELDKVLTERGYFPLRQTAEMIVSIMDRVQEIEKALPKQQYYVLTNGGQWCLFPPKGDIFAEERIREEIQDILENDVIPFDVLMPFDPVIWEGYINQKWQEIQDLKPGEFIEIHPDSDFRFTVREFNQVEVNTMPEFPGW